ncbi:hypothetical protein CHS0354_020864 [Potamilus streckersoni]|uniref:Uncharacterized protein n=1 Tax=Potamilus streckersoni TaxID=2493646 RepID=A0AAE0SFA4_9BIVA|nr:hypothetical protein CHS0354_020864 [Potamilus streckersoni]
MHSFTDKFEWFLISGLVVLVATGMVINVVGKLRKGKVSKTTTNNLSHRNGGQTADNTSSTCIQNTEITHIPEGTRMVLTESKTSDNLTNFAINRSQEITRLNEKHLCSRGVDSANSAVRKVPIDSISISLCEKLQSDETNESNHGHEYDESNHGHEYDELEPIEDVVEQSYEYDMIEHSYIILRPPAITQLTKETREQFTIADSFSGHGNGRKKSPSRVDHSVFSFNVSKESTNDADCTDSNSDIGNRDYSNQAAPPSVVELTNSCLSSTMHSSNFSQERLYQKKRNYQSLKHDTYAPRSESSEFQAVPLLETNLDNPSTRITGHRRRQSCGTLYAELMDKYSFRRWKMCLY